MVNVNHALLIQHIVMDIVVAMEGIQKTIPVVSATRYKLIRIVF
jgi:hypothetical protein